MNLLYSIFSYLIIFNFKTHDFNRAVIGPVLRKFLGSRRLFWVYSIGLASLSISAQDYRYKFKHLNVDEGLAHTDATAVIQDSEGFLWVGTFGGLNKYDGYSFTLFRDTNNELSTPYINRLTDLACYRDYLFIGSQGGLNLFNRRKEKFTSILWDSSVDNDFKNAPLDRILIQDTILFLLSKNRIRGYILEIMDKGVKLKPLELNNSHPALIINNLEADSEGNVWLTSPSGLYLIPKISNRAIIHKVEVFDQDHNQFSDFDGLFLDEKKVLWLASDRALLKVDLYSLNQNLVKGFLFKGVISRIKKGLKLRPDDEFEINSITKTIDNKLWLGTSDGLVSAEEGSFELELDYYTYTNDYTREKINSNIINSLYTDNEGNLWVTTYGGGVDFANIHQLRFYGLSVNPNQKDNTLVSNYIRAILEDEKGNIWIGTQRDGLSYYDFKSKKFTSFKHDENDKNSILSDNIRALAFDRNDNLWVGTTAGISILDLQHNSASHLNYNPDNQLSLTANNIYTIQKDKFGNMWAGSWAQGLNRITESESGYIIEHFLQESNDSIFGLTSDIITHIYADQTRPEVLISTREGLNHVFLDFNGQVREIKHYFGNEENKNSFSSNFIWPVERVNDSILWVGTLGGGLNKVTMDINSEYGYKSENVKFSEKDSSSDVESLIVDSNGKLWIGGNGLTQFDPKSKHFINFNLEDGLQGNSFKIGASHKGKSGRLYFGGIQGLTYFYPDQIIPDTLQSNIALTKLSVNNAEIKVGEEINGHKILDKSINNEKRILLNHLENSFTISFSSLNFGNPKGGKYKYKLEGFDENWIETVGHSPSATYANLDSGDYVFSVFSANANGSWSEKSKSLNITLLPPWWFSTLAKIVYCLLIFLLIYLAFRWILLKRAYDISIIAKRQEEELNRFRLQFFTNISHEFRTPLTLIVNPLEKLIKGNLGKRKRLRYYSHMLNNSKRMLRLINELMDFQKIETKVYELNLERGDINETIEQVYLSFKEFSYLKNIEFVYLKRGNVKPFWFDRAVVEKILYNLLGNAFKFTQKRGAITIELLEDIDKANLEHENVHIIGELKKNTNYIWVKVRDTGRGIPKPELEYIFNRFFHRSNRGFKEKLNPEGSGVGLSLVKSLVALHNGSIIVSSMENVGTTFYLSIPFLNYDHQFSKKLLSPKIELSKSSLSPIYDMPNVSESMTSGYGKPTILIVEDNLELRSFMKENFQDEFEVLEAGNGVDAFKMIEKTLPNLIISDINMPEMSGIELCTILKNNPEYLNLPFVLLTSNSTTEKQLEGANAKADLYISKPFSIDVLKVNIQNIIMNRNILRKKIIQNTFNEAHSLSIEHKDNEFLNNVTNIILENIEDTEFDVAKLSDKLNMSRTNVYNKIKALTNKPSGTLIREIRVKKAAEYLASEDISVGQAMYKVGIQSQSYFTKVFKKEYGKTPSEFINDMGR